MYAIIVTGGKQIRVEVGQTIYVEKLEVEEGKDYTFDQVVLVGGDKTIVGSPFVKGANVVAKAVKQGKSKKITVFKYKAKHNERVTHGHRQPYTALTINAINV